MTLRHLIPNPDKQDPGPATTEEDKLDAPLLKS